MIIKRFFLTSKNNTIKRSFYRPIENPDKLDYSFVPLAYVITVTSILWGFESNNNLNKNKFIFNNFINNIFIDCLINNDKSECFQLKKYLENEINQIETPCQELWSRMFIWADTKVNPCDYDYKSYLSKWDLKNKSISSIWNSKEYNTYRQLHLSKLRSQLEPCKRCLG